MNRRPPGSTLTDTLVPYKTLFRSKDSPASVVRTPRGPRSNKVTPRFSSSNLMRLLTPDCRTPSALAAALKLRYSATTSAWTTETRSIPRDNRSEEHTSELQSLMRISYAVFCLKNKKKETLKH